MHNADGKDDSDDVVVVIVMMMTGMKLGRMIVIMMRIMVMFRMMVVMVAVTMTTTTTVMKLMMMMITGDLYRTPGLTPPGLEDLRALNQEMKFRCPDQELQEMAGKRHTGVCVLVACLTPQQHVSVSQGRICSNNFTCSHTEIEVADPTFHLTRSQYTDTGPTSPSSARCLAG